MKRKLVIIPIVLVLLLVLAAAIVGKPLYDRYSYGKEEADLDAYYGVSGEQLAIVLQDEKLEDKAIGRDGKCYLSLDTVSKYLTEGFYYDPVYQGGTLLFTTATETYEVILGSTGYNLAGTATDLGYPLAFLEGDMPYLETEFLQMFAAFDLYMYDRHVQMYTQWGNAEMMSVDKNTQLRVAGGIKSEILRQVEAGETVELLEQMETWSKVKTSDAMIGYIENKRLSSAGTVVEVAPEAPQLPAYSPYNMGKKVCLGFHMIAGKGGNDTLSAMIAEGRGMNVIAPTWFSLDSNNGTFRNFADINYVTRAHNSGLLVWGVLDDFNYELESGTTIDDYAILSSTEVRRNLAQSIVSAVTAVGLDGLNLDFEGMGSDCVPHYLQFLKELSVLCHRNNLYLSVDAYVPLNSNNEKRMDIIGQVVDYYIIMGYDEHWGGSGNPGSVASLSFVQTGIEKTLEQIESSKVINALPFYMREWRTSGGNVTDRALQLNNTESENLAYARTIAVWDEATGQNYAEWTSGGTTIQIWIEDLQSLTAKINVMMANDLGGVAVWRLGYGNADAWNLVALYASN